MEPRAPPPAAITSPLMATALGEARNVDDVGDVGGVDPAADQVADHALLGFGFG